MIGAIMAEIDKGNRDAFRKAAEAGAFDGSAEAVAHGDPDSYWTRFGSVPSAISDGFMDFCGVSDPLSRFLYRHYGFALAQFSWLVREFDGISCHVDKARNAIRSYVRACSAGREVVFDRSQRYTFDIPVTVLRNHAEIAAFADAVARLHNGNPDPYMDCITAIRARLRPA